MDYENLLQLTKVRIRADKVEPRINEDKRDSFIHLTSPYIFYALR